jgi:DNA-binding transcriptional LysR family regulator
MDRLDGIAAFSLVVETGSFTAAAQRLKLSKSAVSAHVQRLEDRLGIQLLHRTTRSVATTEAGRVYHQHCVRILADAEAAEQAASALHREPRGILRISAPGMFGWMHIAPAVPAFRERFPDIAIDLRLEERHVNLVDDRFDLAIRIGTLPDSPLIVRKLAPSRLVLCAAPDHLKRIGEPLSPHDLRKHTCLCFPPLWRDGHWHLVSKQREERVPVTGAIITNSAEVLRVNALANVGIAMLPTWAVADDLRCGTLNTVLPGWAPPASLIHAVYPDNRRMSAKVRLFVDHLLRHIGRTPYWDRGL